MTAKDNFDNRVISLDYSYRFAVIRKTKENLKKQNK